MKKLTQKEKKAKRFIIVWQKAKDIGEVERVLGMPRKVASMKAGIYRSKHGVPLKRFGEKQMEFDWAMLARIARKYAPRC